MSCERNSKMNKTKKAGYLTRLTVFILMLTLLMSLPTHQASAESINTEIEGFRAELEKTKSFMQDSLAVLIQRLDYIGKTAEEAKLPSAERTEKANEIQRKYETLVSETEIKTKTLKERFFR